jgi:hypothetical protein
MKRISILLSLSLALAFVAAPLWATERTHEVSTEVVSVDAKAHTITIKDEKGAAKTVPVLEHARGSLASLKAGDKVTLTCTDDEKGVHQGVSAIRVAPPAPKHG